MQVMAPISPLSQKQVGLLSALRSLEPGWHTRLEIAKAFGKNQLNPADKIELDRLAEIGVIERKAVIGNRPNYAELQYRLIGIEGGEVIADS